MKSINNSDRKIEYFINGIEEAGKSLQILSQDVRENVETALFGNEKTPIKCSKAQSAELGLRRLKRSLLDINTLMAQFEKYIFDEYSDKK